MDVQIAFKQLICFYGFISHISMGYLRSCCGEVETSCLSLVQICQLNQSVFAFMFFLNVSSCIGKLNHTRSTDISLTREGVCLSAQLFCRIGWYRLSLTQNCLGFLYTSCLGSYSVEKTFIDSGMVEFGFYSQSHVILLGVLKDLFS